MIKLRIKGAIVSYKNPKFTTANLRGRQRARAYSDPRMKEYQQYIGLLARNYMQLYRIKPLQGAIFFKMDAYFKIPLKFIERDVQLISEGRLKYLHYPDLTDIEKLVEDAVKNICFGDDCIVTRKETSKNWCKIKGEESYVDLEIKQDE